MTGKRILLLAVGWMFILLGIAGLFLPVLQGVLFLFIGLIILSSEYLWAHHLLRRLRERFPGVAKHADHAKERAHAWLQRISGRSPDADPP
jgi:uncharacterized membrane protein YbaN (DUF454 family)